MHLLIPFAAPLSEPGRHAAATLVLPRLQALLGRLALQSRDEGDELSLTPPHERAVASVIGWAPKDGLLPWAARLAEADGIEIGSAAWGLMTPAHWHLGTSQVSLFDQQRLSLDEATSRAFFSTLHSLFTSADHAMHFGAPLRWYVSQPSLATLATASLDRVIGRNVDAWLGKHNAAQGMSRGAAPKANSGALRSEGSPISRLQSEAQMLLHTHPLNVEREARGLLPVNSFWLSGCGIAQPARHAAPSIDDRLRTPALADDWAAWCKAWETLDSGPLAKLLAATERGADVRLTLCGERSSATFGLRKLGVVQRLRLRWAAPAVRPLLESL